MTWNNVLPLPGGKENSKARRTHCEAGGDPLLLPSGRKSQDGAAGRAVRDHHAHPHGSLCLGSDPAARGGNSTCKERKWREPSREMGTDIERRGWGWLGAFSSVLLGLRVC